MIVLDARTANAHYPGIGRYTAELAQALAPLTALTLLYDPGVSAPEFGLARLPVRRLAVPQSPRSLAQQWVIPARLARLEAEVYHSPFYLMPYNTGVPTVLTAYDLIPLRVPQGFGRGQRLLYWAAHVLAFNTSDRILTLSDAAAEDFVREFRLPAAEVHAIPPGLADRFAPAAADDVRRVREAYALPERYLLFVGSQRPHKNLAALVSALDQLPANAPPLALVGPPAGEDPRWAAALARAGERARVLGRVPEADLPALYSGAALYVHPALLEGFGFPVLEALGCGAPVACADLPVLRELAQGAAVYFDPRRPEAIAGAIMEALESPGLRTALSERGRLRARAFTWRRAAEKTLEVYRALGG